MVISFVFTSLGNGQGSVLKQPFHRDLFIILCPNTPRVHPNRKVWLEKWKLYNRRLRTCRGIGNTSKQCLLHKPRGIILVYLGCLLQFETEKWSFTLRFIHTRVCSNDVGHEKRWERGCVRWTLENVFAAFRSLVRVVGRRVFRWGECACVPHISYQCSMWIDDWRPWKAEQ